GRLQGVEALGSGSGGVARGPGRGRVAGAQGRQGPGRATPAALSLGGLGAAGTPVRLHESPPREARQAATPAAPRRAPGDVEEGRPRGLEDGPVTGTRA